MTVFMLSGRAQSACGLMPAGAFRRLLPITLLLLLQAATFHAEPVDPSGGEDLRIILSSAATELAAPLTESGELMALAVMDFEELGMASYRRGAGQALRELLTNAFIASRRVRVVERGRLNDVLKELRLGQTGAVDPKTAARVGRFVGAQLVVVGEALEVRDGIAATIRMIDVETATGVSATTKIIPRAHFAQLQHAWVSERQQREEDISRLEQCLRDSISKLSGAGKYPFVDLDALTITSDKYVGKSIVAVGVPSARRVLLGEGFDLRSTLGSASDIRVGVSALTQPETIQLLKLQWPAHAIALRATVSATPAFIQPMYGRHLEAEAFEDCGSVPRDYRISEFKPAAPTRSAESK